MISPLRFLRKLPRRVKSRPETEIADQRLAFSSQTPSIEPSYKTTPKHVKMSISQKAQGFLKLFRVQHVALIVRRPKHPCFAWCTLILLYENFSKLLPRDSNNGWTHQGQHVGCWSSVFEALLKRCSTVSEAFLRPRITT